VPQRLQQLFEFAPDRLLANAGLRAEANTPGVRQVIEALAEELEKSPRLADKDAFRALANVVKQRSGQKGKALFHPIRLALTAAGDGPELDLLVPAIERGAELSAEAGFVPVVGARERAARFVKALASSSPAST
jgi:hypothetical protein